MYGQIIQKSYRYRLAETETSITIINNDQFEEKNVIVNIIVDNRYRMELSNAHHWSWYAACSRQASSVPSWTSSHNHILEPASFLCPSMRPTNSLHRILEQAIEPTPSKPGAAKLPPSQPGAPAELPSSNPGDSELLSFQPIVTYLHRYRSGVAKLSQSRV